MKSLFWTKHDWLYTLVRVVLGGIIWAHGAQKVLGWFGGYGWDATLAGMSKNLPSLLVIAVMLIEFFGGLLLVLGLFGRLAAFATAAVILGAMVTVHLPNGLFMNWTGSSSGEGFEYHVLFITLALGTMIKGSGALSVDRAIWKSLERRPATTAVPKRAVRA